MATLREHIGSPSLRALSSFRQVGKSTLIRCLVKHYTRQNLADVRGPITVVAGRKRRITLIECPSDLCGMMVSRTASTVWHQL